MVDLFDCVNIKVFLRYGHDLLTDPRVVQNDESDMMPLLGIFLR